MSSQSLTLGDILANNGLSIGLNLLEGKIRNEYSKKQKSH